MKRKSFLSSIGAKSVLAAIVITAAALAGCKKEEYTTEIIEFGPARAVIMSTVYDLSGGQFLASGSETVEAGEDGTIAAQTRIVKCPAIPDADRYLQVNDITVYVPELAKGQFALIPIHFYAEKITDAARNVTITEDPATVVTKVHEYAPITVGPYPTVQKTKIEYEILSGRKILNIDEVYRYIDNIPETRAMSNADIIAVLKALVDSYDNMATKTYQAEVTMPKEVTFMYKPKTNMTTYTMSITATVDGVEYTIPNVKVQEAGITNANSEIISVMSDPDATIIDWTPVKR